MILSRLLRPKPVTRHGSLSRRLCLEAPGSAKPAIFRRGQIRQYRAVNHRQLLVAWNTLRLWIRTPLFYYHIAGIGVFSGLFYVLHLERVPVRDLYIPHNVFSDLADCGGCSRARSASASMSFPSTGRSSSARRFTGKNWTNITKRSTPLKARSIFGCSESWSDY